MKLSTGELEVPLFADDRVLLAVSAETCYEFFLLFTEYIGTQMTSSIGDSYPMID